MSPRRVLLCLVMVLAVTSGTVPAQEIKKKYSSAQAAYEIGMGYLRAKDLAKAQEVLEEAERLSPDAKLKGKIYKGLVLAYRQDPDHTKFLRVMDYLLSHPDNPFEKGLQRSALLIFLRERGKAAEAAQRYEAMLKNDPNNTTALYILGAIHADLLRNPNRAIELMERLIKVTKDAGKPVDHRLPEQLAGQYVQSGQFKKGAELYEKLAEAGGSEKPYHLKSAAVAWLKAGDKDKARAVAKTASAGPPEDRTKQLTFFWHRHLGDVFLETGDYQLAIDHLQKAIEKTEIEGYRKDCQKKLEKAKQMLKKEK